jgi:cell division protein ZapA
MPDTKTSPEPSNSPMDERQPVPQPTRYSVSVEIYDQIYNLRGTNPEHIETIARLVDSKMRAVTAHGGTVDSLRVAVLAALNIADELVDLQERYDKIADGSFLAADTMLKRAGTLSEMLDEVLDDRKAS